MAPTHSDSSKKPLTIAAIILGVVAVCLALRALYLFPGTTNEIQGETISVSQVADMKDVRVFLITDKKIVNPDERLQLFVRVDNSTDSDLTAEIRGLDEPGFVFQRGTTGGFPVVKGSSVEIARLELLPSTDRGRYRFTLSYVLTEKSGKTHAGWLSSAIIEIKSPAASQSERFWRRLVGLLKDLTLPIFLAGLGVWFQLKQSARDRQEKILQTNRDTEAREKSEKASRRQEIWQTILPQFYKLSEEHYLPIVRSLILMDRFRVKDPASASKDQIDRLLFEFLFLLFRMDLLRRQRGQFFFRSRKGEEVVSLAWKILLLGSERALTRTLMDEALELLDEKATYLSFCHALRVKRPLHEMRRRFVDWLMEPVAEQTFDRYAGMAPIMRAILHLEANRPFDQYWYEACSEIKLKPAVDYVYPAGSDCASDVVSLKTALEAYLQEMAEYARDFGKNP
jgi:hypothetical protein